MKLWICNRASFGTSWLWRRNSTSVAPLARLYISQPSLSNQIHTLERMLGTDLFVRTSRQVELTAAGRALLEEAPVALAALERAAERARLTGAGIVGEIRLSYTPMANFEILRVHRKLVRA